jgi:hypothetical protein
MPKRKSKSLPARKKSPRPSKKPVPKKSPPPPQTVLLAQFSPDRLRRQFRKLIKPAALDGWLAAAEVAFYQRLFTPVITIWFMMTQRFNYDHSEQAVVDDAHFGGADSLSPKGKALSQRIISHQTTSYDAARQRLPLAVLQQALDYSAAQIRSWVKNSTWKNWKVILLDGSTVRLGSLGNIPQVFPPHGNNRGSTYWCLMRVVVGFCLCTGVAAVTAMGANGVSEQALALPLLAQLGAGTLVVADRNFGIFAIAQAAVMAQAQAVVRLTEQRARALARSNGCRLGNGLDRRVKWQVSARDKTRHADGPGYVEGRLLVARVRAQGGKFQTIFLFTTLTDKELYSLKDLVELYGKRWQVELYLRYVKSEMDLGALNCKSAEMARKEWVAGLLAYNLIRSLMVGAAAQVQVAIGELSFSQTRQLLLIWCSVERAQRISFTDAWSLMVQLIAQSRHPRRRKPRPAEPRAVRHFHQNFPTLRGDRAVARQKLNSKS